MQPALAKIKIKRSYSIGRPEPVHHKVLTLVNTRRAGVAVLNATSGFLRKLPRHDLGVKHNNDDGLETRQ